MTIYPSILTDQPGVAIEQLQKSAESSEIEVVQFDLIDGYFADNITLTPADLTMFDFQNLSIDLHIMAYEPMDMLMEAVDYTDLPIRGIIGQIEKMSSQENFLIEIRNREWLPGLSIDLHTPLESIDESSWETLKILQIMGIEAGFQNQKFSFLALEKLKKAADYIRGRELPIELIVDGGVKLDNIAAIAAAGAESAAVGSGLWQAADFHEALADFNYKATESSS